MRRKQCIFIIILLCFIMVIPNYTYKGNKIEVFAAETGVVTASSLNVREGAGTNYKVLKNKGSNVVLKKGTNVTILKKNSWYQISTKYNGTTIKGYVLNKYIKLNNTTNKVSALSITNTTSKTEELKIPATVTASKLNVRKTASTKGAQLVVNNKKVALVKNKKVTILNEKIVGNQKWYYISFTINQSTKKGYVLSDYIKLTLTSNVKAIVKSSSNVKIRTGAGDTKAYLKDANKKVVSLKNTTKVTITKETTVSGKKWYYITFTYNKKSLKGYIPSSNILFDTNISVKNTDKNGSDTSNNNGAQSGSVVLDDTKDTSKDKNNETKLKTGTVKDTNALNVRVAAGTNNAKVTYNGKTVTLTLGQKVTIHEEVKIGTVTWYSVTFDYNNTKLKGYVSGDYIIVETAQSDGTTIIDDSKDKDKPKDNPSLPTTTLSDEEFEANLTSEGFPESYKVLLRELHKEYPNWVFRSYKTGLDWNEVIARESKVGLNLITNSKDLGWKSFEAGAYNWKTDQFIPFDGSSWVTASKAAVEYYMDPRNFLTASRIFQFESLRYQPSYQIQSGVESILNNTALYNTSYRYMDALTEEILTRTYGETFIEAAKYSGVSPYHLATRVKQEVVTGKTTLSTSVSGTVKGYEGYYNFFNIGATHSTVSGGNIKNGLNYAKNGTTNAATNNLYLLPWDNIYKSIVGGAKYIGSSYIERGQDTVYLQKFNVTPISTYSHQYMANVEAPYAEAVKTYTGYSGMKDLPIVFSIPIYNNMPEVASATPAKVLNPNNWLKTLTVKGYNLTPTFDIAVAQTYNLIVENSVDTIQVDATTVSNKATLSGTGIIPLSVGNNSVTITVIAENGDKRLYNINVVRE